MGHLDVKQASFSLEKDAEIITQAKFWNYPIRTKNYPGGSVCQGFLGASKAHGTCFDGYQLAPLRAPTMNFYVTAKDTYGKPRNYRLLKRVGTESSQRKDYLLAVVQRVPIANLNKDNQALQPKLIDDVDCDKTGTCGTLPLGQYPATGVMTT